MHGMGNSGTRNDKINNKVKKMTIEKYLVKEKGLKIWKKDDKKRIYINDLSVVGIEKYTCNPKGFKRVSMYYDVVADEFITSGVTSSGKSIVKELIAGIREEAEKTNDEEETETVAEEVEIKETAENETVETEKSEIAKKLIGSEKQIEWANDIIKNGNEIIKRFDLYKIKEEWEKQDKASWFIENYAFATSKSKENIDKFCSCRDMLEKEFELRTKGMRVSQKSRIQDEVFYKMHIEIEEQYLKSH